MNHHHFGATTQRVYGRYANHTQIVCRECSATLIGHTIDHGFADGSGRFSKDCPHCHARTFYDGPLPMAEPHIQPLAPTPASAAFAKSVLKPTKLPELETRGEQYLTMLRWRMAIVIVVAAFLVWVTR